MSEPAPHILIVDDHRDIRDALSRYLADNGMRVTLAESAPSARRVLGQREIDLIVLDIMMPGEDGLSLCRSVREHRRTPVILLSARTEELDRIIGLEVGADDYVTKPFDARELISRAKNLIRRVGAHPVRRRDRTVRKFDGYVLDVSRRELACPEGERRALSAGEYQLLSAFLDHAGQVLNRDQLMNRIRNCEWMPDDRYIDVLVGQLRKKLGERAGNARLITTVHGAGYLFTPEVS